MLGFTSYASFVAAVIVFLMIPGPGNLVLISSTGKGGMRAGLAATLGVIVGDQILMWTALAGVATILTSSEMIFRGVQWLGAAYLTWIGVKMLTKKSAGQRELDVGSRRFFGQALTITLLNPKAIMFYMAFLPLFIDPSRKEVAATFVAMALTIACLTFLYGIVLVAITRSMASWVRSNSRIVPIFEKLAGVFLIGFGIRLAVR